MSIAKVSAARGLSWIKEAMGMVFDEPMTWIGGFAIYLGLSVILNFIPVLGMILGQLLGFTATVYFLGFAHAQREGLTFNLDAVIARGKQIFWRFVLLSIISTALFLVCAIPLIGTAAMAGGLEFFTAQMKGAEFALSSTSAIAIAIGGFISFILCLGVIAATAFAAPQVYFHDSRVRDAMETSLKTVGKNLLPLFVYALLVSALMLLSMIPLFLGLLVMMPVSAASYYVAFQELFGRPEASVVE